MSNSSLIYPKPHKSDYGIGIIGAGGIVNGAHIPAYRKAGLNIKAICDINADAVKRTITKWDIADGYTDFRKLIARTDIDIVDIAIPNEGRLEIFKEAVAAGKHILMQKPFAYTYEDAVEMVNLAQQANVKLAINHNARYAPFYRKTKEIIESGEIGIPYLITHEMRINQDAHMADTWFAQVPNFLLVDYEIHHIDLMRYWSGQTPQRVYTSSTQMPGQNFQSDMIAMTTMEFASGLRASLITVDTTQHEDHFWRFTVEGTKGSLYGRIEQGYTHPQIEYRSSDQPGKWIKPDLLGDWFPDAFYGTMFELMEAIQGNREPSISGRDNLGTLKLLFQMIASNEQKKILDV